MGEVGIGSAGASFENQCCAVLVTGQVPDRNREAPNRLQAIVGGFLILNSAFLIRSRDDLEPSAR